MFPQPVRRPSPPRPPRRPRRICVFPSFSFSQVKGLTLGPGAFGEGGGREGLVADWLSAEGEEGKGGAGGGGVWLYSPDRPTCCCPFAADAQSVTHMCVVGGPTKIKGRRLAGLLRAHAVKVGGVVVVVGQGLLSGGTSSQACVTSLAASQASH